MLDLHTLGQGRIDSFHLGTARMATSMVLVVDCLIMPMPTMGTPLPRRKCDSRLSPSRPGRRHRGAPDSRHRREPGPVARKLPRVTEGMCDPHGELAVDRVQAAGRQYILGAQRVRRRSPPGRGPRGPLRSRHPHGEGLAAADPHPGHTVEHREAVDQQRRA